MLQIIISSLLLPASAIIFPLGSNTIELPQNSIDLSFLPSIPTLLTETTNTPFAMA